MPRGPIPGICQKCGSASSRQSPCKPCRNAYLRARYAADPSRQTAAKQRYVMAYPERVAQQRAAYKQRPEIKLRERLRTNLGRCRIGGYGHGILKVSEFDFQRMIDRQYGMCAVCARTDKPLTLDHIVPVSKGGLNGLDNLQLLCRSCNTKKMTTIFSGIGYRLAAQELMPHAI